MGSAKTVEMSDRALIYGRHSTLAALARDIRGVTDVWVQENRRDPRAERLLEKAESSRIAVHRVPRKVLDRMVDGARHQGIIVRYRGAAFEQRMDLETVLKGHTELAFLLVLDGVQDPHNLGACLRSAEGAGVHAVVAPRNRAVGLTPAVRKVACGAAESVPFLRVVSLARTLHQLRQKGVRIVGAAGEAGASLYEADLTGPLAMVMGGEERGLRKLTREHCDLLVRIPMKGRGTSLNVSVAAGICLYEVCRQRNVPNQA